MKGVTSTEYWRAIIALCLCLMTQSWLLISVFPYSGFMAIHLIDGVDEENVGSYAGLLASAFMIGRGSTSYGWGKLADRYGRLFVLKASLTSAAVFSILFGLAPTFGWALTWRFLLGCGNGMMGTSKTCVSELAPDATLETRGMSIVIGMWGWGQLLAPALSGALAEPLQNYPSFDFGPFWSDALDRYPFLLPNLVSVFFSLWSILFVALFVPETLRERKRVSPTQIPADFVQWVKSLWTRVREGYEALAPQPMPGGENEEVSGLPNYGSTLVGSDGTAPRRMSNLEVCKEVQLRHAESCSMLATSSPRTSLAEEVEIYTRHRESVASQVSVPEATMASLWSQRDTRNHLLVYWLYSFISVSVDEAFPLFCISQVGGLSLDEAAIGKVLSVSGLLFAVSQYFVYSAIVDRFGLLGSVRIGATWCTPFICLIPLSLVLNREASDGSHSLTIAAFSFLSVALACYRIFSLVFFSSITVLTNRTVIPEHRGTMNGMNMLGASLTKGVGPAFAGLLVSVSFTSGLVPPEFGSMIIFGAIGLLGAAISFSTYVLLRDKGQVVATTEMSV